MSFKYLPYRGSNSILLNKIGNSHSNAIIVILNSEQISIPLILTLNSVVSQECVVCQIQFLSLCFANKKHFTS